MGYEIKPSNSGATTIMAPIVQVVLLLILIGVFLVVVATVFTIKTFVRYYNHASLWIALAFCLVLCITGGLLNKLMQFDGSPLLSGIGIAVLLITCYTVDLKNRDTLMRENVNLIDEVLHKSWWGSEDTPLEQENELAA